MRCEDMRGFSENPRRVWQYNMEVGLTEMRGEGVDWINLAQQRKTWRVAVNTDMNIKRK
jgi:hypothetical protein